MCIYLTNWVSSGAKITKSASKPSASWPFLSWVGFSNNLNICSKQCQHLEQHHYMKQCQQLEQWHCSLFFFTWRPASRAGALPISLKWEMSATNNILGENIKLELQHVKSNWSNVNKKTTCVERGDLALAPLPGSMPGKSQTIERQFCWKGKFILFFFFHLQTWDSTPGSHEIRVAWTLQVWCAGGMVWHLTIQRLIGLTPDQWSLIIGKWSVVWNLSSRHTL